MLLQHSRSRGAGIPGLHDPGPRRVTDGLPVRQAESAAAPGSLPRPELARFPARPVPPLPHNVIASVPQPLLVTPALQIVDFSFLPTQDRE